MPNNITKDNPIPLRTHEYTLSVENTGSAPSQIRESVIKKIGNSSNSRTEITQQKTKRATDLKSESKKKLTSSLYDNLYLLADVATNADYSEGVLKSECRFYNLHMLADVAINVQNVTLSLISGVSPCHSPRPPTSVVQDSKFSVLSPSTPVTARPHKNSV
ncbi:hypothetical protein [Erwinia tasmaniensis]|uniref:Uncharacterized protein n=1 Tax=Erwinia tasmaniensis (strain DSM 17950 / CFBP 7177 / CIP 109463 / NCPPB 4357 / Et1/99) TaxID=465817 RepID=B2VFS8_ERWT9|nr:hypothetical protein [Erwinia tasmaniensis]CAO97815.1 hypothetical protein ETA_27690 [Erwinia tasmaniensis Et1/99]